MSMEDLSPEEKELVSDYRTGKRFDLLLGKCTDPQLQADIINLKDYISKENRRKRALMGDYLLSVKKPKTTEDHNQVHQGDFTIFEEINKMASFAPIPPPETQPVSPSSAQYPQALSQNAEKPPMQASFLGNLPETQSVSPAAESQLNSKTSPSSYTTTNTSSAIKPFQVMGTSLSLKATSSARKALTTKPSCAYSILNDNGQNQFGYLPMTISATSVQSNQI